MACRTAACRRPGTCSIPPRRGPHGFPVEALARRAARWCLWCSRSWLLCFIFRFQPATLASWLESLCGIRLETSASTLTGNNHPQRALCRTDRYGRLADEFAVSIHIDLGLSGELKTFGLKIFHLLELQMIAAVDGRKQAQQFCFRHSSDDARVQQAVGHIGFGRNMHPAPVPRRVRKSG